METRIRQLETELEAVRKELHAAHEKQRGGDEVFRRFSDSGIIGIALFDLSGKFLLANEALLKMIGCQAEELTSGKVRWAALTPPEWARRDAEALEELKSTGQCASYEREYERGDGTRFWGLFTGVMMGDRNAVAFLLDITERKKADETLRFQASLLDAVEQAAIATDLQGAITYWNRFAQRLYGWTAAEVIGRNVLEVTPAESHREHAAAILARLQNGESWSGEHAVRRRDGSAFTAWVTDSPIYDSAGTRVGIVGISADITSRKETEEALRASENRLGFLAEASRILASSLDYRATLDRVARMAVPILADWCDIRVLDERGAIRRVAVMHSDPTRVALVDELEQSYPIDPNDTRGVAQVLRTGQPEIYRDIPDELLIAGARDEEHLRISRALGLKSALVMPLAARGRPLGTITLAYAESNRRYTEEEIALAEDLARRAGTAIDNSCLYTEAQSAIQRHQTVEGKLMLLTEATGALISSLNLDRVLAEILALSRRLMAADAYAIWRLDRAAGRWTIAAAEGLSDQYQSEVIPVPQSPQGSLRMPLIVTDVEQEPLLAEHRGLVHRKEGIRAMLVSPLLMQGAIGGTLVFYYRQPHTFDDIELKVSGALANLAASAIATAELYEAASQRADQLAEADRRKDEFMAMLAHELRNPLAAVSNALHVLRISDPDRPAWHRSMQVLERQIKHQARLLDDLLDVSRITRGKIILQAERLDLAQLVRETTEDLRSVIEEAGLTLSLELPKGPIWLTGDRTRLAQVVGNLMQNALKFTNAGGQVTVRVAVEADPRLAEVAVRDTGIGIESEMLPRVFDTFAQADHTLHRSSGGLGLGLALVKGMVELHGGTVSTHSAGLGHGSQFTLRLPREREAAGSEAAPSPRASTVISPSRSSLRNRSNC